MNQGRFRVRALLDGAASVGMIVVAGVVLWSTFGAASRRTAADPSTLLLPQAPLALDGAAISGSPNARVAMVEFSDFECPFCRQFAQGTRPILETKYVESGILQIVFRHLPLTKIHPNAQRAAEAAVCAAQQGRFREFYHLLFGGPDSLEAPNLVAAGAQVGLQQDPYRECLKQAAAVVEQDVRLAKELGVSRTPAFFVGVVRGGSVTVLKTISGARPLGEFTAAIDAAVATVER